MASDIVSLNMNLPMTIASGASNLGSNLADGISGTPIDRISLRRSRFRFISGGVETFVSPEEEINLVLLGAQKKHSRIFYMGVYQEGEAKGPPDCFSNDGEVPSPKARTPQSTSCGTCPQNEKGSAAQGPGKACAYKKRIVVAAPDQFKNPDTPFKPYLFDVNGKSMFGEGIASEALFSLGGYADWLTRPRTGAPKGIQPDMLVTRVRFNDKESVPCVLFGPASSVSADGQRTPVWLTLEEIQAARSPENAAAVQKLLDLQADDVTYEEGGAREATATTPAVPATTTKGNKPMATAPTKARPTTGNGRHWIDYLLGSGGTEEDVDLIQSMGGPETPTGLRLLRASVEGMLPADLNLSLEAPSEAGTFEGWADAHADAETIEMVMDMGGPFTEKGAKLWAKLIGVEIPAQFHPGAAPAAASAKISWQSFAQTIEGTDEDDISMVEDAGGPSTEKGAKLWNRLFGVDFPANVDLTPATDSPAPAAPAPAPAPAPTKRGRGRPKAETTPAPAPAPAAPARAGSAPTGDASSGAALAAAFSAFDQKV